MFKFFKKILQEKKKKKITIKNDIERKKIDFVYRFLLNNYEIQLKGKVDLPAFHYAYEAMLHILKTNQLEIAYAHAKKCLREQFEKEMAVQNGQRK